MEDILKQEPSNGLLIKAILFILFTFCHLSKLEFQDIAYTCKKF